MKRRGGGAAASEPLHETRVVNATPVAHAAASFINARRDAVLLGTCVSDACRFATSLRSVNFDSAFNLLSGSFRGTFLQKFFERDGHSLPRFAHVGGLHKCHDLQSLIGGNRRHARLKELHDRRDDAPIS